MTTISKAAAGKEDVVLTLNLSDILIDPDLQVRAANGGNGNDASNQVKNDPDLQALVQDIDENGQLVPVSVFSKSCGQRKIYCLVDGHRRYQALQTLKKKQIRAAVIAIKEKDALKHAFTINNCRKSLSPLDVANAIMLAKKRGWSKAEIRKAFDLQESQLKRYGHLFKCPDLLKEALTRKDVSMAQALAILDVAKNETSKVPAILFDVQNDKLSAGKIKRKFGSKDTGGRPPIVKEVFKRNRDGSLVFNRFKLSANHGISFLKRIRKAIERGVAAVDKLLHVAK